MNSPERPDRPESSRRRGERGVVSDDTSVPLRPGDRPTPLVITVQRITPASNADRARFVLAYVDVVVNDVIVLYGIVVRVARNGHLVISYPAEIHRRSGRRLPHFAAASRAIGHELQRQVLEQVACVLGKENLPS